MNSIEKEMRKRLYELSYDQIIAFSEQEQVGGVSNLINGLDETVYALLITNDDYENKKMRYIIERIKFDQFCLERTCSAALRT